MFSDLTKALMSAFWRTLFKGGFETLRGHNIALGRAIHARFDDLDLTPRSQVCQNHKLQIIFLDSYPFQLKRCMVATHI